MLRAVQGIYRNGKIELLEVPEGVNEAQVVVTFLPAAGPVDLESRGLNEAAASDLRWRLQAFAEDWERPEMDV